MVNNLRKLLINVALILAASLVGSFFMMSLDQGGTPWLKFVLYVGFFASLMSPFLFSSSSSSSCSFLLNRLRKQS
jgi:hypothetical protein